MIENTDPDAGTAEARSNTAIKTKINSTIISLIRSKDEGTFDSTLTDFESFLDSNNWDAIKDIKTEKMAENRERLK